MKTKFLWLLNNREFYSQKYEDGDTKVISILIFNIGNALFNVLFAFVFMFANIPEMVLYNTIALILYCCCFYLMLKKYRLVTAIFIDIVVMCSYIPYTAMLFGTDIRPFVIFFPIVFSIFFLFEIDIKYVFMLCVITCITLIELLIINAFGVPRYTSGFEYLEYVNVFFAISSIIFINYTLELSKKIVNTVKYKEINELEKTASTDFLTGLYNKRYFENEIQRNKCENAYIVVADIDFFKRVNDKYGHNIGDTVLKSIADTLNDFVEEGELAVRWGGEEFLILLKEKSENDIEDRLKDLRISIKNKVFQSESETFNITMTFGAKKIDTNFSIENNVKKADDCLYYGKQNGRDRIVFYTQIETIKELATTKNIPFSS
ncbi:MAG: GGDEF domain-containing protein [Lachnospirales bacterium]